MKMFIVDLFAAGVCDRGLVALIAKDHEDAVEQLMKKFERALQKNPECNEGAIRYAINIGARYTLADQHRVGGIVREVIA
tara:strand:+ start:324 stop:563 length:240 start_codon:yes stop_codon:yes gene_type:complete